MGSPSVLYAGSYPWPGVMAWAAAIPQGLLTLVGMMEHSTKTGYCIAKDKVGVFPVRACSRTQSSNQNSTALFIEWAC